MVRHMFATCKAFSHFMFLSDSKAMDGLIPQNSSRSIARGLEQPLMFAIYISPITLFADTSLHKLEIGRGLMLEAGILL